MLRRAFTNVTKLAWAGRGMYKSASNPSGTNIHYLDKLLCLHSPVLLVTCTGIIMLFSMNNLGEPSFLTQCWIPAEYSSAEIISKVLPSTRSIYINKRCDLSEVHFVRTILVSDKLAPPEVVKDAKSNYSGDYELLDKHVANIVKDAVITRNFKKMMLTTLILAAICLLPTCLFVGVAGLDGVNTLSRKTGFFYLTCYFLYALMSCEFAGICSLRLNFLFEEGESLEGTDNSKTTSFEYYCAFMVEQFGNNIFTFLIQCTVDIHQNLWAFRLSDTIIQALSYWFLALTILHGLRLLVWIDIHIGYHKDWIKKKCLPQRARNKKGKSFRLQEEVDGHSTRGH